MDPGTGFAGAADALRAPDFRRLFAARFVSAFGTAMAPIAMAFGVLELTGSPRWMGAVIACQTGAQMLLQLLGGALADRRSRKRVMVGADLLAAASQCAMAALLLAETSEIWLLGLLMAVNGVSFAFHWPAMVGIVPVVVPRERLQSANALLSLAHSGALALGGACAGVLVAVAGAGWAIAVDAATFALSAALVAGLRARQPARAARPHLARELREGWREFIAHRWLWTIVLQFSLVMAGWHGGFLIAGPVVAERFLGGPAAWGPVAGALGAGLLVGALLGMRFHFRRPMLVATLCVLVFALPLGLLAVPAPVAVVAAGAFAAGVAHELFAVLWFTALHTHVAPESLSRVSAYDILGSLALAPVGEALAGPLIVAIGTGSTLAIAAALVVAPTLAVLAVPEVRRLPSRPSER